MSVQNPAHKIKRWSVVGMEGMWTKMFDPPTESPPTPDRLVPTNPVPEVMENAGYQSEPKTPHTVELDLMHGLKIPTWDDAKELMFFLIRAAGNPAAIGTFPGPCVRMPRGAIFHAHTLGHGPPPHTIHWHGIEPTPMNDGVGHCSMEIGDYTYQFQPNFIGTYFYHCHRNTVQHFEFGLYGMLIVDPPDAYFATQNTPEIKIGHCRDGKRRTAANLAEYSEFPGFNNNPLTAADPLGEYQTDPHAMTVTYDVEALWVYDDRDSVWSDLAPDARATYPKYGDIPGVNDNFHGNAGGGVGSDDFFAFNDFNPDYWYVTGVPVPAHKGGIGTIPTGLVIPPELNSGVSGTQVSISAQVGQTILLRCLNGAYNSAETTFPVDIVVIAWDGRALGVPPYGQYNHAYKIPAGTPIRQSVARRCDILIRSNNPIDSYAEVKFINTRGENIEGFEEVMVTARIPIKIGGEPIITKYSVAGVVTDHSGQPLQGVTLTVDPVSLGGTARQTVVTDDTGAFSVPELLSSMYEITPSLATATFIPPFLRVAINDTNVTGRNFSMSPVSLTVTPDKGSPQQPGSSVLFTAAAEGGSGAYQYRFRLHNGTDWTTVQDFSATATWTWNTADAAEGAYMVQVSVRNAGSTSVDGDATTTLDYVIAFGPSTGVTLTSDAASPQPRGTQVKFTAVGQGGSGSYEYQFILVTGGVPATVQAFSPTATWTWNSGSAVAGTYQVQVLVRNAGSSSTNGDADASVSYTLAAAGTVGVSLASDLSSPRNCGEQVVFTANGTGGTGSYEYEFLLYSGGRWKKVQAYSTAKTWTWATAASAVGTHKIQVNIRTAGSISTKGNAKAVITYKLAYIRSTGVTVGIDKASPQTVGTTVTFTAAGQGGTGFYQYEFWLLKKSGWKKMQSYSATPVWTWDTTNLPVRTYRVQVRVRSLGSKLSYHARNIFDYIITA